MLQPLGYYRTVLHSARGGDRWELWILCDTPAIRLAGIERLGSIQNQFHQGDDPRLIPLRVDVPIFRKWNGMNTFGPTSPLIYAGEFFEATNFRSSLFIRMSNMPLARHHRLMTCVSDLNGSGSLDQDDLTYMIHNLQGTWMGDANLDGKFTSSDFVGAFQNGGYETGPRALAAQSAPEPSSITTACFAFLLLTIRRRR